MKHFSEIRPYVLFNAVLVAILILYGLLGAIVVRRLESQTNAAISNEGQDLSREELLKELWNKKHLEFDQWSTFVQGKLDSYENNFVLQSPSAAEWNLADAWLFACTIFTTIGYGNIAPVSTAGRLFCIFYALIGIPLFSVVASSLASLITDILQLLHSANQRRKQRLDAAKQKKNDDSPTSAQTTEDNEPFQMTVCHVLSLNVAYLAFGAVLFSLWEEWTLFESFYYCFVTLTTIGLGDYVPQNMHHTVPFGGYILIGLVLVIMLFGAIEGEIAQFFNKIKQRVIAAEQVQESKKEL